MLSNFIDKLRSYDVFRDYYNDLEDIINKVFSFLASQNWGKLAPK